MIHCCFVMACVVPVNIDVVTLETRQTIFILVAEGYKLLQSQLTVSPIQKLRHLYGEVPETPYKNNTSLSFLIQNRLYRRNNLGPDIWLTLYNLKLLQVYRKTLGADLLSPLFFQKKKTLIICSLCKWTLYKQNYNKNNSIQKRLIWKSKFEKLNLG